MLSQLLEVDNVLLPSRVIPPQLVFKIVLPILASLAYQVLGSFVELKLNAQEKLTFYNIKSSYS